MTDTAVRERAARNVPCPTCRVPVGHRCITPRGRTRAPHPERLAALDARLDGLPACPATSPQSAAPCDLLDHPFMHYYGHEHRTDAFSCVSWATSPEDHARWEAHP